MKLLKILAFAGLGFLAACGDSQPQAQGRGVYMLLDTSGTYTQELDKAQQIIAYLLTRMEPGDAFAVARIDTGSFSEKDIIAKVSFDDRPSAANQQKRKFLEGVNAFVENAKSAAYTDITGGMLQAVEYLNEQDVGERTIIVFSDMKEDLPEGFVRDMALPMDGIEVVAVNVTKLRSDNVDPREYMDRLAEWQAKVESGGGSWRVVNDLDRLGQILE
ncbi:MAG: VWA domain-containing protein [Gammaproteobacteria bacterium]|nr:VWA domain-containing protein [Gammaproteobacteria bacterium]